MAIDYLKDKTYTKDPDEKKDYGFNWAARLGTDTIVTSDWEVPAGITQSSSPAASHDDTTTTIWLEGGTATLDYIITNRITTTAGSIQEDVFKIKCRLSSER